MQNTASHINRINKQSLLSIGVGVPNAFYNKLIAEEKLGVDKYDSKLFPRQWSGAAKGKDIKKSIPKGSKFDVIVINDSKHYKDLERYFNTALKHLNEGGKIILTHSIPKEPLLITRDYNPHQQWCGDVYEFVLALKSRGGYKIESYEIDYGITEVTIDESVKSQEIDIRPFEDWYFERKELMNIVG